MSIFTDQVKRITALISVLMPKYDESVAAEGLRECALGMRRIRKALTSAKNVGKIQQLSSALGAMKSLRVQIKTMQKRSSGKNSRKETACDRVHWADSMSAFNSRIRNGILSNLKHKDPEAFLLDCKALFKRRIKNALKKDEAVKVNAVFCGEFQIAKAEQVLIEFKYFTTSNSPIYRNTDFDSWFDDKIVKPILIQLEEFQERDSGWALTKIINLGVNINKFTPQLGSSYIELPAQIKRKEACINVKNNDDACFAWAVTSALCPIHANSDRVSSYPHYSEILKLKGVQFPMTMRQVPNFEKQNEVSINVYILKKTGTSFITLPTYLTKEKRGRHVNLLLIQDRYFEEEEESNDVSPVCFHYLWIKDLSRLVSSQLSKHKGRKYFCDRCLHYFHSEEKLDKHIEDCEKLNSCEVKMPEVGKNILKFKNFKNKVKAPFVVYADLESVLSPTSDPKKPQQHIPAAIGYYMKCSHEDSLSFYRAHRSKDCMRWFANEMKQLAEDLGTVFWCPYDIDMSQDEEVAFRRATYCHICEQSFSEVDKKVRDHNHFVPLRNYRGAAHEGCNINYQDTHVVPVVFHNLSNYDANFIIEDVATRMGGKIDLHPITKEKYISFTKRVDDTPIQLRFIDSFRFMNSSLDKLASYLNDFPNLKLQFMEQGDDHFMLLTKKGVIPYDYIDSFDRFSESFLPPIDAFYNKLEDNPCPRRLYQRAQHIWEKFECRNLGQYVDLYMKTDIMLLADVFEQFRTSCHQTYNLDPAHYFTLPGFTWDAMLKHMKQELELLTDLDIFLFVEKGIRGGLSQVCSKRRAHANNKYMPNHNPSKADSYLMYYDVNNQYGWAMSQALPYGGFEWCDTNIDVTSVPDDSDMGYILEVDLEYPEHLHDQHKDLPFCPLHIDPQTDNTPASSNAPSKLMATLHPKKKYVIHYRSLKQALENGLILTKIHRALKFKQAAWLKSYIDLNTNLRKAAKNEFEKNLFKLMNNAVFGKTMENIRKRVNVRLLTKWAGRYGAQSYISKPEFKSCTIFNENLVAVELNKLEIWLNTPIYVGMSILDLTKTTIYEFHYGYMVRAFEESCSLLYTDTDSLIYELEKDPYDVMRRDHHHFDTSDYPVDNIYDIPLVNMKVLGKMKDGNNGTPMTDFVGLRSKLYAIKVLTTEDDIIRKPQDLEEAEYEESEIAEIMQNRGVTKKAKGVKYLVVKTMISFEDYVECLEKWKNEVSQEKIALSPNDDKRYLIPGTFATLPWGHYKISNVMDTH